MSADIHFLLLNYDKLKEEELYKNEPLNHTHRSSPLLLKHSTSSFTYMVDWNALFSFKVRPRWEL